MARPVEGGATVTLTIDGQTVEVAKGTNVLEAAKLVGRDICHFCYHPGLTIAASCRQCMVEIEKNPKLVPSCQQQVADGMVVHTETERVLQARQQLLEFTLVNHPIDCPICDKAGECQLQRHYMDHDHSLTRVDVPKIRKPKVKDIGKHIVLDAERCILCSRCVRFCEEIPGTSELTMAFRGDHEQIDIAEGHRLDNPYSINVVDICPVGALTSKDFRFQIRAWELSEVPTTCNGCATGCAVSLQFKHEQAYRVLPREDADVNGHWMCDDGRFIYKELAPELRVNQARVEGDAVDRRTAVSLAAERLRAHRAAAVAGPSRIAAVFSAVATNEANLALAELAELLGADRYVIGREPGEADDILRAADKNPNTAGAEAAAGPTAKHAGELALALAGGAYDAAIFVDGVGALSDVALDKLRTIDSICLADREGPLATACAFVLPAASWAETIGSYTNRQGRLRHVQPAWRATGERRHRADLLRDLMVALEHTPTYADARALSRTLAEQHGHALLLALLTETVDARPRLLRWAHTRG
jgi:NADH-quinone oxidoreductase subunit G